MADVSFETQAYTKIVLHAAKYPHCAVNGVLLAEDNKKKESKSLKLVDSVPFFHHNLTLAPMMEVALTQVCLTCSIHYSIMFLQAEPVLKAEVILFTACSLVRP